MTDQLFPLVIAVLCLLMLARLALGDTRRARLDRALIRMAQTWRRRALALWYWRSARQAAAKATQEAMNRARRAQVDKEGNVYKPEAFKGPRKPH
jgi:hypothetical protein